MNYILLLLIVAGVTLQQVATKSYGEKVKGGTYSFSVGTMVFALLFFVLTSGGELDFSLAIVGYSLAFAVANSVTTIFMLLAINEGPLALTSLIVQYSLLIPTLYGLFVLGESVSICLLIGITFLIASIVLINFEKKKEEKKISLKWAIYSILTFVGNGSCSMIQKMQQTEFDGAYKNEFMIVAYVISIVILFGCMLSKERKQCTGDLKHGFIYYLLRGLSVGLVNFLVLVLTNRMEASVMFPVISSGGIVATFLLSVFVYREKLSLSQNIGVILGVISLVFLNI